MSPAAKKTFQYAARKLFDASFCKDDVPESWAWLALDYNILLINTYFDEGVRIGVEDDTSS